MESNAFLPESMYSLDPEIMRKTLRVGDFVTCKVVVRDFDTNTFYLDLGSGVWGTMCFGDSTIYRIYREDDPTVLCFNVSGLINRTIRAEVVKINDDGSYVLSRREHMKKALEYLKGKDSCLNAVVTSVLGEKNVMVDIGGGVLALIPPKELYPCFVKNVKDVVYIGKQFPVTFSYDEETCHFSASRLGALPPVEESLFPHQIVSVKIVELKETFFSSFKGRVIYSYYVAIAEKYKGILDTPIQVKPGARGTAIVKNLPPKGARLRSFREKR